MIGLNLYQVKRLDQQKNRRDGCFIVLQGLSLSVDIEYLGNATLA
ncbi:hypothetical protein ENHYD8BJ_90262 [Enhydrobacter sp. 8BJ]|nr:hypothetical protein ENHYD8BJ_90262 [Enhydrobacter sp. 8BJ]